MAVQAPNANDQGRKLNGSPWADIDLYVSTLPGLTNLDPVALATADKSLTRGGNELVYYSNSVSARVYYIGVKSEDQMGSFYKFISLFTELPLSPDSTNILFGPLPYPIPDGTPEHPEAAELSGYSISPSKIRRLLVSMDVTHTDFGDLLGDLSLKAGPFVVLNNHSTGNGNTNQTFLYDDSGEGSVPGTQTTDGPGSLNDFIGRPANGDWSFVMVDNAMFNTGMINGFTANFEPQPEDGQAFTFTVLPQHFIRYAIVDVPVGAVDLTVALSGISAPWEIYIRKDAWSTLTDYDKKSVPPILPPGGFLSLTKYDNPPLSPGRYYISVYNPNNTVQDFTAVYHITVDLNSVKPTLYTADKLQFIPDDMVSYASQLVTNRDRVAAVEVGLRIDHPRISDLAVTLISPRGSRVLLVENRGYASTNGFGSDTLSTNIIPVDSNGGAAAYTNVVDTGTTSGTFNLAWEFYPIPDHLKVYYEGNVIFDTGLVSGPGVANVSYGPGQSTLITITVNEGNNPDPNTAWNYTLTATRRKYQYLVLTENTNLTHTPIKFAAPPLGSPSGSLSNLVTSGFEGVAAGNYVTNSLVAGWLVVSNQVTVVTTNVANPVAAYAGSNYLALGDGAIARLVPTVTGKRYVLSLASRKVPDLTGLVGWWRGDGDTSDSSGNANHGTGVGGLRYAAGMVGQAFALDGTTASVKVPARSNLNVGLASGMTIEGWIRPASLATEQPLVDWNLGFGSGSAPVGAHFWISVSPWPGTGPGCLYANLTDTVGTDHMLKSAARLLVTNALQHVAVTYDKVTGRGSLYLNGQVVAQQNLGVFTPQTSYDCYLGIRPAGAAAGRYAGLMDEFSIYARSLTAAELQAIYAAGSAGKCGLPTPPSVCSLSGGLVTIDGQTTTVLTPSDTNWVVSTASFTANSTGTVVTVEAVGGTGSGLLLDEIIVKPDFDNIYFLPEQPMDAFFNEMAYGDWKLELWDNRVGATNPPPTLLSWQLSFYFVNTVPATAGLTHGQPVTNTLPAGSLLTYAVPVPVWAKFATNRLTGNGPLNLIFNQHVPPTGSNDASVILLTNINSGTKVLSAISQPPLLSGETYYLGVQNKGTTPVTFVIEVDFDITPLANGVPVTSTVTTPTLPRYFQFDVSANTTAVSFSLTNLNGDANLYVRRDTPLPTPALYDYASVNPGSDPEWVVIFTNSIPRPLAPGRYYLGVFNNDYFPVRYTVVANEYTNPIPNIITLTNGVPYAAKSTPAGSADYYRFVVPSDAVRGQFEVNHPDGQVALYMRRGFPPFPGPAAYDYASTKPGTNDQLISVYNYSSIPLTPGEWFLVVTNLAATPVNYSAVATTWTIYGTPIYVSSYSGGTNTFCLTWNSLPGVHYVVQGRPDLVTPGWFDASPTITPTGYQATWCLGLTSPYQFFRVTEGVSTNTTAAPAAPW
jgi:subtilisin-like proprotein convertase family protein